MGSVVRRARMRDVPGLMSLIDTRRIDRRGADLRSDGVLEGPSPERLEEAIRSDIVVVAERDDRIHALAMVMVDQQFRLTPWWALREALSHPEIDPTTIDARPTAMFEILVAADDAGDRRPAMRAGLAALRAASADHDIFVAATLAAPIENTSALRFLSMLGFLDIGAVEYDVDGVAVTTRVHVTTAASLDEALGQQEVLALTEALDGPAGLPPLQFGPAAWLPDTLEVAPVELERSNLDELIRAAEAVASVDDLVDLGRQPLGALDPILQDGRHRLLHGPGFIWYRGLPLDELSPVATAAAVMLIGRALGAPRMQNANGDLLGHVRDVGLASSDPNVRIYQTNERQTFHTDSTDVVGLCCLHPATEGGDSLLVSALSIYNEMWATTPDLAARLFEPLATDRRGEVPEGERPWFTIPPLTWFGGRLSVLYQRQYIDSAQRFDDAPRLDEITTAALDEFDRLAEELSVVMRLERGDLQFVNNHALLHDRTAFRNEPMSDDRHLLRLWLSMPGDQELDPVYAQRYGSVTVGDRGGIALAGVVPRVVL